MTFTGVNTTKKIDSLSAKNKKKLDYKQLKISGDYQHSSDEEQEEQEEQKEEKQDKKQDEKQEKELEEQKEESEESKFLKYIENKSKGISYILFNYYCNFKQPSDLAKILFEIKDKKKKKNDDDFVEEIKNRWSILKDKNEKMPGDEKENERVEKILEIVKEIVRFSRQNQ